MLSGLQLGVLVGLGAVLWGLATMFIRLLPNAFLNPTRGAISFAAMLPAAVLSVWLVKILAALSAAQCLPGCAVVGAVAMMIDGAALRWFAKLYGSDEKTLRLAAAWLLWGYGVSLAVALIWSGLTQPKIT